MYMDFDVEEQQGMDFLWSYCDVFISCLDSCWRYLFTAEDPLVIKWWNAKFLQIYSNK